MEITLSPLKNRDTVGNYIFNNVFYKDIKPILSTVEKYVNRSNSLELKEEFDELIKTKNTRFLERILSKLKTEEALNIGYILLKNHPQYTVLSEENKYVFLLKKTGSKELEIVLLDNEREIYIGNLTLLKSPKTFNKVLSKLFNSNKIYQVSYISLDQRLTGQGLGVTFYKLIYDLEQVDVLLSSENLYKGSYSVWSKSLKSVGKYHGIVVTGQTYFLMPFNSLESSPINEPSIEMFFISKTMSSQSEKTYNELSMYENTKTLFYKTQVSVNTANTLLQPLVSSTVTLNMFNDLVEGDLDSKIPMLNVSEKTYSFILGLQRLFIDVVDSKVDNVCIMCVGGNINISQKGKTLTVELL